MTAQDSTVQQEAVSSSEEAAFVIVDLGRYKLKVPKRLYEIWDEKGWPEDPVLEMMASEERWRP